MKIVNKTGQVKDTKVLDDEGKDITGEMAITKIVIDAAEGFNRAVLTCEGVELDLVVQDEHVTKE